MERNSENGISLIQAMGAKISEIHQLAEELKQIGHGMPVIEKNTRCILSFIHALKFGVSDIADVMITKEDNHG